MEKNTQQIIGAVLIGSAIGTIYNLSNKEAHKITKLAVCGLITFAAFVLIKTTSDTVEITDSTHKPDVKTPTSEKK